MKGERVENVRLDSLQLCKLGRRIEVINEEVRVLPDVVTELLARIGEQTLLWDGCSAGVLPKEEYGQSFAGIHMWSDEERLLVVEIACEPRRLVLDEILGWQWYNSEGPEE